MLQDLFFKLQQEVLKFTDICLSWSSAKTNLAITFLNAKNRSSENVSIVTVKKIFGISLLNNLFISYLNLFIFLTELKTFVYLTHFSPVSHFYNP